MYHVNCSRDEIHHFSDRLRDVLESLKERGAEIGSAYVSVTQRLFQTIATGQQSLETIDEDLRLADCIYNENEKILKAQVEMAEKQESILAACEHNVSACERNYREALRANKAITPAPRTGNTDIDYKARTAYASAKREAGVAESRAKAEACAARERLHQEYKNRDILENNIQTGKACLKKLESIESDSERQAAFIRRQIELLTTALNTFERQSQILQKKYVQTIDAFRNLIDDALGKEETICHASEYLAMGDSQWSVKISIRNLNDFQNFIVSFESEFEEVRDKNDSFSLQIKEFQDTFQSDITEASVGILTEVLGSMNRYTDFCKDVLSNLKSGYNYLFDYLKN